MTRLKRGDSPPNQLRVYPNAYHGLTFQTFASRSTILDTTLSSTRWRPISPATRFESFYGRFLEISSASAHRAPTRSAALPIWRWRTSRCVASLRRSPSPGPGRPCRKPRRWPNWNGSSRRARTRIKNLTAEASRAWAVANANPATISKAAHRKLKKVFHPDPEHATATPERWAHITLSHIQKTQNLVAQNARCSIVLQPMFRLRGKTALAAASRNRRRS